MNLQELLESNFVNEEREKRCDECGHTTASLETKMVKTPKILQIYLKRYNYGQLLDGKVKNYVEIPATVNISNFSSKKSMSSLENSKHTSSFTTSDEKLSSLPVRSSNRDNGSSSLEFVSNKSPLTINNNTIYSPQGIRDDPKFNYRVN